MTGRPILAYVVLCLAGMSAVAQHTDGIAWFASDPAGMAFDGISGPEACEWALRVAKADGIERSQLFQSGEPVKSWTRERRPNGMLSREAFAEGDVIREERLFDAAGRPEVERRFLENGDVEETSYRYSSGRLVSKTTTVGEAVVSAISYLYAPDGRLASAKESSGTAYGTSSAPSGGSSSWRSGSGVTELRVYDRDGRLVAISTFSGADRISREERVWNGSALERSILATQDGMTVTSEYQTTGEASGKVLRRTTEQHGTVLSTDSMKYDDSGRLSRVDTVKGGTTSAVEYEYDDSGTMTLQRQYSNGTILLVIRYESPSTRVEELYDGGTIFARVRYEDGRRTLEELLRDGVVVRTRRFD